MWIFLLLNVGYYFSCFVSGTSEITTGLQDITVTIDGQAKFSCVVKGKGESKIQWWFVSGKTSIAIGLTLGIYASSTKYLVEETSNTNNITISTLTVKSVSHDDEGLYRCVVRIPRVPYPAWPKEDGFIHVTERDLTSSGNNEISSIILQTSTDIMNINEISTLTIAGVDQFSDNGGHNISSTVYRNIALFLSSFVCVLLCIL